MAAGTSHYVHGPCQLQPKTASGPAYEFLGWSQDGATIQVFPEWEDVPADFAGKIPADRQWMGEVAIATCVLTKWDEDVLKKLQARPKTSGTRGTYTTTDMGSLMLAEGLAYIMAFKGPYSAKAFQTGKIPAGYRFTGMFLAGPDEIDKMATRFKKVHCVFFGMTVFATDGSGTLFDHDMTGLVSPT